MNQPVEMIALPAAELLRGVPAQTLCRALLDQLTNGRTVTAPLAGDEKLPRIGAEWNGGIYAGLSIADNAPIALVLLPGDEKLNWNEAVAWAEKQGDILPSRFDQLVLFKNLKSQFQETWYWSGEQYASDADYAWYQGFAGGYQSLYHKSYSLRARAVRRVKI
jgi:hypothetical protein